MPKPRLRIADLAWAAVVVSLVGALILSESKRADWEFRCRLAETNDNTQALYISSFLISVINKLPRWSADADQGAAQHAEDVRAVESVRSEMYRMSRLLSYLSLQGHETKGIGAEVTSLLLYPEYREKAAKEWLVQDVIEPE